MQKFNWCKGFQIVTYDMIMEIGDWVAQQTIKRSSSVTETLENDLKYVQS